MIVCKVNLESWTGDIWFTALLTLRSNNKKQQTNQVHSVWLQYVVLQYFYTYSITVFLYIWKHYLTRKWRCCSLVCSSCWTGDGLRPGWGVTCTPGSFSSPGVFSHLDGASSKPTNGVSPTTWPGLIIWLHLQNSKYPSYLYLKRSLCCLFKRMWSNNGKLVLLSLCGNREEVNDC